MMEIQCTVSMFFKLKEEMVILRTAHFTTTFGTFMQKQENVKLPVITANPGTDYDTI